MPSRRTGSEAITMSYKLLHERLRDADGNCAITAEVMGLDCMSVEKCEECHAMLRKAIADEIERCYHTKSLDADGVEVKAGDTMWCTTNGEKAVVVRFERSGFIDQNGFCLNPKYYTHKEPDSLEKLRDYVEKCWQQEYGSARDAYRDIADRLTALMERGER